MVMVSHDLESLAKMCNRAVWMDHGRVLHEGPVDEMIAAYRVGAAGARRAGRLTTPANSSAVGRRPADLWHPGPAGRRPTDTAGDRV